MESVIIREGITEIPANAFYNCSSLNSFNIPSTVEVIGSFAFGLCTSLRSITIPASVKEIPIMMGGKLNLYTPFAGCANLTNVFVDSDNTVYESYDGCLYNYNLSELLFVPQGKAEVQIPASVNKINPFAFLEGYSSDISSTEPPYDELTIEFLGDCPTIGDNTFTEVVGLAYYPAGNATWTEDKLQDYGGSISWKIKEYASLKGIDNYTYSFMNSRSAFNYADDFVIPLSSYQLIFGENTKAEFYYSSNKKKTWGGNCNGFASTSALLADENNGIIPSDFNPSASRISDLAVGDIHSILDISVTTFIEAMQIAQYTQRFKAERQNNMVYSFQLNDGTANLDRLYGFVKSETDAGRPVLLALVNQGGHSVLAYGAEEIAGGAEIRICDSNRPGEETIMTLEKGSNGSYISWSYYMGEKYGTWGSSEGIGNISYIPYSVILDIWSSRGDLDENLNTFSLNTDSFAIYGVDGSLKAFVQDGELVSAGPGISMMQEGLDADDSSMTTLTLPVAVYSILNLNRNVPELEIMALDNDLGLTARTSASEVIVAVDDSCSLNSLSIEAGVSDTYDVTLNSSQAGGYSEVRVEGKGAEDTLEIEGINGVVNISNCVILGLTIDGKKVGAYTISASATNGGAISPSGDTSVMAGRDQAYTITPDSGYEINDVYVDGDSVGAVTGYTFTKVESSHTIMATFKKKAAALGTPVITGAANTVNGIKVTWGAVEGAEKYRLFYKVSGGTWKRIADTGSTSYTWTGAENGTTYTFTVRCINADGTAYTSSYDSKGKTITCIKDSEKPMIITNPTDATVALGKTAVFKVAAEGSNLSYQWYYSKDDGTTWTKWTTKTKASFSLIGSETNNGALYKCRVSNGAGYVESKAARMTVTGAKPMILTSPSDTTVELRKSASFKVTAGGSGLSYQWYYSKDDGTTWTKWTTKTKASFTLAGSETNNGALYKCCVSNDAGYVESKAARLTVTGVKPRILTHPSDVTVELGKNTSFKVVAGGNGLSYQWYYSKDDGATWTKWTTKTKASFTLAGSETNNGALYKCRVSNDYGYVESKAARITVTGALPRILTQPEDVEVDLGKAAEFKVTAGGSDLIYQWYYSKNNGTTWTKWTSKKSASFNVTASTTNNGCLYKCRVSNSSGYVESKAAKLTVNGL